MAQEAITALLEKAIEAREKLFDVEHKIALRLFNGFLEGCPELVVDLYGRTLVLHDYSESPEQGLNMIRQAQVWLQNRLPWLRAGILKVRNSPSAEAKRGQPLFGEDPDRKVQ
jgi:23S rRNA (cytosine1962-C5)-methyltransferase